MVAGTEVGAMVIVCHQDLLMGWISGRERLMEEAGKIPCFWHEPPGEWWCCLLRSRRPDGEQEGTRSSTES